MKTPSHRVAHRGSGVDAAAPVARPRAVAIVIASFVLLYIALEINSCPRRSATWDEPMHLTAGYVALTTGDYRVDTTHPPSRADSSSGKRMPIAC